MSLVFGSSLYTLKMLQGLQAVQDGIELIPEKFIGGIFGQITTGHSRVLPFQDLLCSASFGITQSLTDHCHALILFD